MAENVTVFVVEGEKRDLRFIAQMDTCFFKGRYKHCVLFMPAKMNLYMLYNTLKDDNFETDIVELLRDADPACAEQLSRIKRDDISQIYLFFDYDSQQENLSGDIKSNQALKEMLDVFDNETEYGKLYLSYPMVEALYDCKGTCCQTLSNCFVSIAQVDGYKTIAGKKSPMASRTMKIEEWRAVLGIFGLRVNCLFGELIDYEKYRTITPRTIFDQQQIFMEKRGGALFVLSAFPEFLYDYFPVRFWNTYNTRRTFKYEFCPCNRGRKPE